MLWPDEFEPLRAQAQQAAQVMREHAASAQSLMPAAMTGRLAARRAMAASFERRSVAGSDVVIAGVPCRRFGPPGGSRGTYLHMHGGAMTLGSPLLNDTANEGIASRLGVEVVSVDYRLAPEHPHPAASDDCVAVAVELLARSSGRCVVGGESAGANLAVLTLLRLRDEVGLGDRVTAANLVYGVYDFSGTPSNRGVGVSPVAESADPREQEFTRSCYLPDRGLEELRDPSVSPLYADLRSMPRALFTVGSADRLLDDTLFMERRWRSAGNESELAVYPDCGHSFLALPIELAHRASERISSFLGGAFGRPGR